MSTTHTSTSVWTSGLPRLLPPGYAAAPLSPAETGSLRICAVVRTQRGTPDPGPLVVLRETMDSRVILGCLADAAGKIHEWLEIWIQDASGLASAPPAYRGALNNAVLDERWRARCTLLDRLDSAGVGGGLFRTGFEEQHPPPLFIDSAQLAPLSAKDPRTGAAWALCTDEGVLSAKGSSSYASTLARHLHLPQLGDDTSLLPLDGSSADPRALGLPTTALGINPASGLLMIRAYRPISYEQFIDTIGGVPYEPGTTDGLLKLLAAASLSGGGGWLALSSVGSAGRLVETLHIKLALLGQALGCVREFLRATQTPMLNVSPDTFRIGMGEGGGVLPRFWTTRVLLSQPGEGVELPLQGTQISYFLAARTNVSIYAPAHVMRAASGKGMLRLRNVVSQDNSGLIFEGTLQTHERLMPGVNDLLWMRFGLGGERFDLYGMVDAQSGLASSDWRIRTLAQRFSESSSGKLRAALGVPVPDVTFEMVPLLSAACDLYSMGVLAVRTLLVTRKRSLPVALDEIFSLAAEAARLADTGDDLPTRIQQVFKKDPRWEASLGPQHLIEEGGSPGTALESIPPRLWCSVLAAVCRMFTGVTPDSRCKDFGDAPTGGQHRVFDGTLDELYALLKSCRTLIVSDYGVNREIRSVVKECLKTLR